jgi:putative hydrolase of the HAD superfamily
MIKRALVFDFGNVLMSTVDYAPRHRWDDRLGLPHSSVERAVHNESSWIGAQTGQISLAGYWADVGQRLRLDDNDLTQLRDDFYSGDRLNLSLLDYIRARREEGHAVGLLSNDSLELVDKLRRLDLEPLFDAIVISAQIGVMKPHPGAYEAILKRLGRSPQETLFIDDRQDNVDGANAVGMIGVRYIMGIDLATVLRPLLAIASSE